jgi:hypothetical protein
LREKIIAWLDHTHPREGTQNRHYERWEPTINKLNNRDDPKESAVVEDESLPEILLNIVTEAFLFDRYFM